MNYRQYVWMDEPDADSHVSAYREGEQWQKEQKSREELLRLKAWYEKQKRFADDAGWMVACGRCGEQMLVRYADIEWCRRHQH